MDSGDDDFFSSDLPEQPEQPKKDEVRPPVPPYLHPSSLILPAYRPKYISSSSQPSHRPLSETFGKLPTDTPLLFLFSGKDHSFPFSKTTPRAQFDRWERAANKDGQGGVRMQFGVVEGASHQVDEIDLQPRLVEIVKGFLQGL